jgi:hypothetical protein
VSTRVLRTLAWLFVLIAFTAGALQFAAFIAADRGLRHLIVALFALSVGVSVSLALRRRR